MTEGSAGEARITALMGQYAMQMRPWVRLISVLAFIGAGFMVVVGAAFALVGSLAGSALQGTNATAFGAVGGAAFGGIYVVLGLVFCLPPAVFLHRTASAIKRMQSGDQTSALEAVLKNQKSYWRFVGILSLIGIVAGVLAFVLGVGAAILIPLLGRGQI